MEDMNFLFENESFEGVMIVIDNTLNITKTNITFQHLMGYSKSEIVGTPFTELIVPDEKSLFFDIMYKKEIQKKLNLKLYHKSKAYRNFSLMIYEFNDYKLIIGKAIVKLFSSDNYFKNDSKSSKIEDLFKNIEVDNLRDFLNFKNNNISLILNLLPLDVWIKDKYHKYIFINKSFEKNTSFLLEDVYMKEDFDLFEDETANNFVTSDRLAIDSGRKINYSFHSQNERLLTWTDVTKIPIYNNTGSYIGILGFGFDITQMKLVEEALEKERDRFKSVVDNVDGLIFEIDNLGNIVFITGSLIKALEDQKFDIFDGNVLTEYSDNAFVIEKVKLALNGTYTELEMIIDEVKFFFKLNPRRNEDGTYSIIGKGTIREN